jgi:hypothetical protein
VEPARRAVWRDRCAAGGWPVVLHHLPVPVETAVARVTERARAGVPFSHEVGADGVRHLAALFEPPSPDEGIEIRVVAQAG